MPDDTLGWQLLASGRYLAGDRDGALEAWNRIGRPVIDLVRIDGSRNIRFKVLADQIRAPLGSVLAPHFLELARRRLSDVPGVRHALVDYEPVAGGLAEVRVVIDERPVVDPIWLSLMSGATRAVAQDEIAFAVASPTRLGELWSANVALGIGAAPCRAPRRPAGNARRPGRDPHVRILGAIPVCP